MRPLEGLRVLDLTQVLFGPFCTMLLSDMGAEVLKIERPQVGDMARGNGPFVNGLSTYYLSLNRGKKSVTLDLQSPRGQEILLNLVEKSDALIQNYKPGTMEKLGLSYEVLKQRNPRIVYVCGSGFGQYGPYSEKPAFDIIVQSMGGIMSYTGEPDGKPVRPGASYGDITAGLFLCISTLAALRECNITGRGQMVDIGMLDCQVTAQENAFVRYLNTGELPKPLGTRHPVITPFQAFPTRDGYVSVAPRGGVKDQWPLFCSIIERIDIVDDPRFKTGWLRTQNYQALEPLLNTALKAKTTAEWITEFEQAEIPCGPLNNIAQVAADKHIQARDMIVELEHPELGKYKVVNNPFKFSEGSCKPSAMAPDLGQHTEEVLRGILGMSNQEMDALKKSGII
jgi:CoA:oxalate CoA-transferase